ncbi:hypothetical protein JTB14_005821 [Gonioctena quinquepunctata]|nr:hypothetical protein JTB14_005821 [Gonioctena quinquepunctata]
MAEQKKKYKAMEPILNHINGQYISLSEDEKKRNNTILKELLGLITQKMREKDNLFKEMYFRVFFGGSYYDGLRVGQPDEFDLDLLLSLPKIVEPVLTTSNKPGYVHLKFNEIIKFYKQADLVTRYKGLDKLIDEKTQYLEVPKVLRWMERVVTLALNTFDKHIDGRFILKSSQGPFYAKICKGGPAFTLKVEGRISGKIVELDIDLVPCFVFGKEQWPVNGFRANPEKKKRNLYRVQNPTGDIKPKRRYYNNRTMKIHPIFLNYKSGDPNANKPEFFIVPKPLKNVTNSDRYWRLSFQEQEREIIDGKKTLKPTVKLLKRMRDILGHKCIASYYIKTVLLWQTDKRGEDFWNNSLSFVFMSILRDYYDCLKNEKISYYWNKNNNLIGGIKKDTLMNLTNKIKLIIEDVDKHPDDAMVIAKYLLKADELNCCKSDILSNRLATVNLR